MSQKIALERTLEKEKALLAEIARIVGVEWEVLRGRSFDVKVVDVLPAERIFWYAPLMPNTSPIKVGAGFAADVRAGLYSSHYICGRCTRPCDPSLADPERSKCCFASLQVRSSRD